MRLPDQFRQYVARNDGVFIRAGALANGLSARQFRTGAAHGEWVPYRGLWILAATPPTWRTVVRSALLRAGPDARLTGDTALSLYGLELRTGAVAISVPTGTSRKVSGAVLLRDHDREEGARLVEGFAAMSRTRSVVDALRLGSDQHGRRVLDEVLRRGWISAGELRHWCERLRACRGLASLHARASDAECGAWVESERVLHSILTKAGLRGWSFNQEIRAASGRLLGIGDCVNLALKIVIEVDGWAWHTSADRFQRDRDRQNALVEAGWTVLRFTWLDVSTRPDYVATAIRRAMARAA